MKKGGYKIIDFGGSTLSSTPVTKTGILTSLKDNYGKVVLLTGIIIGGNVMDDCFSTPISDGDDGFKLNAYDGYIAVTKAGAVTYTVASPESLADDVEELTTAVGDLDDLNTTAKTSAVVAINEVVGSVGDLSELETTDKDSVVDAINEVNGKIPNIKFAVKTVAGNATTEASLATGISGKIIGVVAMYGTGSAAPYTKLYNWTIDESTNTIYVYWTEAVPATDAINFKLAYIES